MQSPPLYYEKTDIQSLWFFLRRNAALVLGITFALTLLALLLAFVLPPRFRSEAVVLVDSKRQQVPDLQALMTNAAPDNFAVRSEIDIITSRAIIDRVIDSLGLMANPDFNPSLQGMSWLARQFTGEAPIPAALAQDKARTAVADYLKRHLDVKNDGRTYIITIRYADKYPERAARIANAFADQFLEDQLEVKFETARRTNDWLAKRTESLRTQLSQSERAVEDYKIKHNLVGVGEETVTQKQLDAINPSLLQARAELAQAQARLNGMRNIPKGSLETSSVVISSPLIQQLKQQEAEVRRKEADLATRYGNRHPMIINTRNELASIRAKIDEEAGKVVAGLRNEVDIARSKVKSLEDQLIQLKGQAGAGNQAMVTLRQLQREATANRALYEAFLSRFKEVDEQQDLKQTDARIIAHAEIPARAYFPNPLLFTLCGLCFGLIAGFAMAYVLEALDKGYRTLEAIEKAHGLSGLGIVPFVKPPTGQSVADYVLQKPLSGLAEALRATRAAIHFSNVDTSPKVIMVSSSLPHEGKTTFCLALARVQAMAGQKVLLIDADMRRAHLRTLLKMDEDKPHLAALLTGETLLEKCLLKDQEGLDVLLGHNKTPNPHDLLASKAFEKLIATVREKYDLIIIDTPPILAVADAAMVARLADANVFVLKWAHTPREVIAQSLQALQAYTIKLTGVVLTQVDLTDQKRYGYGDYGYYYGQTSSYYTN